MAKWAKCDACGGEALFDAYATYGGEVVETFKTAFCPKCSEDGDGDIGRRYTVVDGPAPEEEN